MKVTRAIIILFLLGLMYTSSSAEGCPEGVPIVQCLVDPCDDASCEAYPDAECKANYCGGCNAEFFDVNREKVNCDMY